jgi:hypothetical protein
MKIWKVKEFIKDARKAQVTEEALENAAREVAQGVYEAKLSKNTVKKRVPRAGGGKRGGYRTVVAIQNDDASLVVFLELYAKNNKGDVTKKEIAAFEEVAKSLFAASPEQIRSLIEMGTICEKEISDE